MLDWLKSFLVELVDKYFVYIWDFLKSVFETFAQYFLDLFVWFFEFVYEILNTIFEFFIEIVTDLAVAVLEKIAPYIPENVLETITASYEWLKYINEWVPVTYGLSLFVAYYSIAVAMYVARFLVSLLPIGRI